MIFPVFLLATTGVSPILYNAIGVVSIVVQFLIFQMKSRKWIIVVNLLSNAGWLTYFALQGDWISGLANIIGILSNIVYIYRGKYRWADSKWWLVLFLVIAGVFSVCTFRMWNDIFPMFACLSSMIAFFMIKEENIRKISLFTFSMFCCNSISKLYVVALIADITALASVVISLYRYRNKNGNQKIEE